MITAAANTVKTSAEEAGGPREDGEATSAIHAAIITLKKDIKPAKYYS